MEKDTITENLIKIKEENDLKEVAVINREGELIETTQENNFKADQTYYALLSGAVNMISKGYNQRSNGLTIELEDTEIFLHYALDDDEIPDGSPIIGFEYEPQSIERPKRKSLIQNISDLIYRN